MKISKLWLPTVLFVTACGGSGSGSGGRDSQVTQNEPKNETVTVTPTTLIPPTEEECERIMSDTLTESDLDLSAENSQLIHDTLREVDFENGYQLFLRNHVNMLAWMKKQYVTLDIALHETNHHINYQIGHCNAFETDAIFSLGKYWELGFLPDETKHNNIIAESISEDMQKTHTYDLYINRLNHKFDSLLDEYNSYTIELVYHLKFLKANIPYHSALKNDNFQVTNMLYFMAYTQHYLKVLRQNYPETYEVVNQTKTQEFIQHLWRLSEAVLIDGYKHLTVPGSIPFQFFFELDDGVNLLKYVYSDEGLMELDLMGITHLSKSDWQETYLHED